jgi:cytochrome b involved in lipid metabolism
VSNYFDEHPGGRNVLTEVAGSDATEDFEYLDHSDDAFRIMRKLQVGVLSDGDRVSLTSPTRDRLVRHG